MGNLWHVRNWFRVGHNISWKLNWHTLFGFLDLTCPNHFFYLQSQKKHEFIFSYLRKELPSVIEKYKKIDDLPQTSSIPGERNIWVLWWQGEDAAPPLVKACIRSTMKNANGATVRLITKDNFKEFVDIPDYIIEKQKKGYISFAQLSDIMRYLLLYRHGGLWLDATVFTSQPIPPDYFRYNFYSQHTKPVKESPWVQNNAYHGFIVGSLKGAKLASFMRDMFLEYWKSHDTLVDYLMVDYLIALAMQEYPDVRAEIDALPWSSERLYDLVSLLDEPFDEAEFEVLKSDCIFSKLDWHKKYKLEKGRMPTYYSHILHV